MEGIIKLTIGYILDNHLKLKIIELLAKNDYYKQDLQKKLGVKSYKSLHIALKQLEEMGVVAKAKEHNTQGQRVLIKLDKAAYRELKPFILELAKKHKIKLP